MDFPALSQQCAPFVAPSTMAAIVKTESGFQPWSIAVNGGARLLRQPASRDEAVVTAKWLITRGYNIDLGLGQVNVRNLARTGLSIEDAFDDCKNLKATAKILQANYQRALPRAATPQGALQTALSLYNTGSMTKGFVNGYVHKVLGNSGATANWKTVPASSIAAPDTRRSAMPGSQSPDRDSSREAGPDTNVYGTRDAGDILVYRSRQ